MLIKKQIGTNARRKKYTMPSNWLNLAGWVSCVQRRNEVGIRGIVTALTVEKRTSL